MLWFGKNEKDEITLIKRLAKIESDIIILKSEILSVTTDQKIIRDKVLRKIQFKKEKEEEQTEETQNLYSNNPIFF